VKIQIYSHKTREDVTTSVDLGVDFIGVATGELGRLPDEVSYATCRSIFSAIPTESHVSKVALTVASDLDEIMETIAMTSPDVIHLSGDISSVPVQNVAELRSAVPGTKIMQAIPVSDDTSINLALEYQLVSDYIILDTDIESYTGIGATGSTQED
jgi:phosphoribosylanthranilate isomerase